MVDREGWLDKFLYLVVEGLGKEWERDRVKWNSVEVVIVIFGE